MPAPISGQNSQRVNRPKTLSFIGVYIFCTRSAQKMYTRIHWPQCAFMKIHDTGVHFLYRPWKLKSQIALPVTNGAGSRTFPVKPL